MSNPLPDYILNLISKYGDALFRERYPISFLGYTMNNLIDNSSDNNILKV